MDEVGEQGPTEGRADDDAGLGANGRSRALERHPEVPLDVTRWWPQGTPEALA
jgi:hypothetical protein